MNNNSQANGRAPNDSDNNVKYSSTSLEHKLKQLRDDSLKHGQVLTQKLASSQSGQNLLHIGTSLSTLPPDLNQLVTHIHPIISATENSEKNQIQLLENLIEKQKEIKATQQRIVYAKQLELLYQDLVVAENIVLLKSKKKSNQNNEQQLADVDDEGNFYTKDQDEIDYSSSLERAAFIALSLLEDLNTANEYFTRGRSTNGITTTTNQIQSPEDSEHAQFIVKLAPRIRRLESDTISCLTKQMDTMLKQLHEYKLAKIESETMAKSDQAIMQQEQNNDIAIEKEVEEDEEEEKAVEEKTLLILGNCMRGLAMLGRGKDVENLFARVSIIPIIRSKLSMGLLDEGGSRGECKGLPKLLNDMIASIANIYGPLVCQVESMFGAASCDEVDNNANNTMDIDLLTAGVWVPITTALMADNAIKMAIFSPGIASILQANYVALDNFLSNLAIKLLTTTSDIEKETTCTNSMDQYYYRPTLSIEQIQKAQDRIYAHMKTAEFAKKWNLPIYYQLRFGECSTRLNKAVDQTKRYGWSAHDVYTGTSESAESIRNHVGFEIGLFLELYDLLFGLWKPDVILRPLTNRFLRGAIQLIGRVVSFVSEGMDGELLFGEDPADAVQQKNVENETIQNGAGSNNNNDHDQQYQATAVTAFSVRKPYCWGESEEDVAAVTWELTVLDSTIRHDYVETICAAISGGPSVLNSTDEISEMKSLVKEVLEEASNQIHAIIDKAWNDQIVKLIIAKCSAPLGAVKGVAATYRMTNRPPPTQASPFVGTILRPLKEFDTEFINRIPHRIGSKWKQQIVVTVAERYALAVEDLIATVQRTEEALKSRKARRTVGSSGIIQMSDGEKVKLQLFLDYEMFAKHIKDVGIEPITIIGLSKLKELTVEGERLSEQQQQSVIKSSNNTNGK